MNEPRVGSRDGHQSGKHISQKFQTLCGIDMRFVYMRRCHGNVYYINENVTGCTGLSGELRSGWQNFRSVLPFIGWNRNRKGLTVVDMAYSQEWIFKKEFLGDVNLARFNHSTDAKKEKESRFKTIWFMKDLSDALR